MKGRVTLYVGGTTFEEVAHIAKFEDAKRTISKGHCVEPGLSALKPLR